MKYDRHKKLKVAQNTFAIVFWAVIVILCLIYKDQITVDNIVAYAPDNMFVAAVVMLMLFAVKSVLVFVYCGLLYAASGILFPVPIAILVNILGSLVMAAIPFWIGKRAGVKLVDGLLQNHPKLKFLKDAPNKSPFFMSFFRKEPLSIWHFNLKSGFCDAEIFPLIFPSNVVVPVMA